MTAFHTSISLSVSLSLDSPGDYDTILGYWQITEDDVVEQCESFNLILEASPNLDMSKVTIAQGVAIVHIVDDDGMFTQHKARGK